MENIRIKTDRLVLRRFEEDDMEAIYLLFSDEEVNTFLPWYPVKDIIETKKFFDNQLKGKKYSFAICLNDSDVPIGYIHMEEDDSHDFGYVLRKDYWHKGIVSEASFAIIKYLKGEGITYITATHDINNPRSGAVMKRMGMKYCYSYKEWWQPKNVLVIFRMYQLNLDEQNNRVYQKYWNQYKDHFIETDI